jgi:hypothetical protein
MGKIMINHHTTINNNIKELQQVVITLPMTSHLWAITRITILTTNILLVPILSSLDQEEIKLKIKEQPLSQVRILNLQLKLSLHQQMSNSSNSSLQVMINKLMIISNTINSTITTMASHLPPEILQPLLTTSNTMQASNLPEVKKVIMLYSRSRTKLIRPP